LAVAEPTNAPNPEVLVERIRAARRELGLTQQQVANELDIARTTVVAIEKGERPVNPDELVALARLYKRPVSELLRPTPVPADFVAQFRLAPERGAADSLVESVAALQALADDYVELERVAGAPLPQSYPPEANTTGTAPRDAGESLALGERNRLGLGDGPVFQLRQLLESDVGLRIFALPLPSEVAGLFVWAPTYGACVAFNSRHPFERQRWSLAHEYAHFLAQRSSTEVTRLGGYQRVPAGERFADAFAENFLMPASGLKRRFHEIRQARQHGVTPADLLHLADRYQVSLEALVRRLENLGLLRPHTLDKLVNAGFRVGEARQMLELAALPADDEMLPLRYRYLAVEAHLRGEVSEGQFARLLRTDRVAARSLAQHLSIRVGLDEEGTRSEIEVEALDDLDTVG
jgi:Zn-dependent peptidase ImmA (M78 family)/transcriptional regulator with XRE-family HTH domain